MILKGDNIEFEEFEPAFRSCWECNGCHEHLKKRWNVHSCFGCDRTFFGPHFGCDFYDNPDSEDEPTPEQHLLARKRIADLLRSHGLQDGESSTKLTTHFPTVITFGGGA